MQCNKIQCNAIKCNKIKCDTIQYNSSHPRTRDINQSRFILNKKYVHCKKSKWIYLYVDILSATYSKDMQRLLIKVLTSSSSKHSTSILVLAFNSVPRYCTLQPYRDGTSLLGLAPLILQDGVVSWTLSEYWSGPSQCWTWHTLLPCLHGLELLMSCLTKLTYLPSSCCLTLGGCAGGRCG